MTTKASSQSVLLRGRNAAMSLAFKAFVLWLPAAGIVCALLFYRYLGERELMREEIERSSIIELETIATSVEDRVLASVGDARMLSSISGIRRCLTTKGRDCRAAQDILSSLSMKGSGYDQARLVCVAGRERVRVNFRYGVEVVEAQDLQDKSERYYVKEGMSLAPGEVYVSPLDLNREHGLIENPHVPMLRFVAPVFEDGNRLGMVVLNLDATVLLGEVHDASVSGGYSLQMLNSDGYWLKHPERNKEWGFMLPDREGQSLATENPSLWKLLANTRSLSVEQKGDLYVSRLVAPVLPRVRSRNRWYVVKRISQEDIRETMAQSRNRLTLLGAGMLLMFGVGCWLLVRSENRRKMTLGTVREQNAKLVRQGERLLEERSFYRGLFENNQAVFMLCDEKGQILDASRSAGEYYGYGYDRLLTLKYTDLAIISKDQFGKTVQLSSRPGGHTARRQHVLASGDIRDVTIFVGPVKRGDRQLFFLIIQDITDVVSAQRELRENEEKLRAVTESSNDAVIIMDPWGRVAYWNRAAEKMFGYEAAEAMGRELHPLIVPEEHLETSVQGHRHFLTEGNGVIRHPLKEFEARRKDGSIFPIERSLASFRFNGQWWAAGTIRDISERKDAERRLRELATTDALTGLANRRHFYELLENELHRVERYGLNMALIMFDVDHFKKINDTKGHDAGDDVLRALSALAREVFREVDVVGRVGGEEFCVMLPETDADAGLQVATRFRIHVEQMSVSTAEGEVRLTVSLGLAVARGGAVEVDQLMKRADTALYRAKEGGRNRVELAEDEVMNGG